ncbi:MAG: H4MPT-linked C1 transfer pathway protein, partial [Planctomycetes bacterium]|nr:H4MPT-linked C1 transfer pathway protein [Planctomycetota bacterium]
MAQFVFQPVEMNVIALDIGGANLKLADGKGFSASHHFPLWKEPTRLAEMLEASLAVSPSAEVLAVTMTGELADCFTTKAEGVCAILDAVEQAASGRKVLVYFCDGRLVEPQTARAEALLAGASNWHVLADYVRRFCHGKSGLLIDIGSTTSDIIPVGQGGPLALGRTDPERLAACELVYTGVERSPVCAVVRKLSWRGKSCPVAQEVFATTLDAYLLLGDLPENAEDFQTADSRSRTKKNAHGRLAHAICADTTLFSNEDGMRSAEAIREAQLQQLEAAAKQVLGRMKSPPETIVVSGQGEFLARQLVERIGKRVSMVSLAEELGPEISRA